MLELLNYFIFILIEFEMVYLLGYFFIKRPNFLINFINNSSSKNISIVQPQLSVVALMHSNCIYIVALLQ